MSQVRDPEIVRRDAIPECERRWFAAAGLPVKGSYRVDEVCRLLDMSARQVHVRIADGRLPRLEFAPTDHPRPRVFPTRIPYPALAALLPEYLRE